MSSCTVVNVYDVDMSDSSVAYCGRPSKFGNPFMIGNDDRRKVIEKYRVWVMRRKQGRLREEMRAELAGKKLACFCHPLPCHCDVIKEIVEGELT